MLKHKKVIIITLVILLAGLVIMVWVLSDRSEDNANMANSDGINYSPPTEQDKKDAEQNKQEIIDTDKKLEEKSSPPLSRESGGKRTIDVIISYSGQYGGQIEVGAYANVFEDGGSCTATFKNGDITFTKSVQAIKNVKSVDCPAMTAKNEEFVTKGTWGVVVTYDSVNSTGTSSSNTIEVN